MFAWVHRHVRADEGISLVETLISIMLLGLVLSALGSTLTASMASARQNEGLTHGTALATEILEEMQATPWGEFGFYDNDGPAWRATVPPLGGLTTVSRGPLPASPDPDRLLPQRVITRDGRTYTVRSDIAWQASPRYIRMRVEVTWTEGTRPHSVVLEGRRARRSSDSGGLASAPEGFVIKVFNLNPDPVELSSSGLTEANSQYGGSAGLFEVETNEPAQSVTIAWAPSRSATLTAVGGSGNLKWTGPLPVGQSYNHGSVSFTATAVKQGAPATQATSVTAALFARPVAATALDWDVRNNRSYAGYPGNPGDRLCVDYLNKLRDNHPFNLTINGLQEDDAVVLIRNATGVAYPLYWQSNTTTGSVRQAIVPRSDAVTFSAGTTTAWTIRWTRSYDGQTQDLNTWLTSTGVTQLFNLQLRIYEANGNSPC